MTKETGGEITRDMLIAEVIARYPETEKVFREFFGKGCHTCPGSKREDVFYGSMMHNVSIGALLKALNSTIKTKR